MLVTVVGFGSVRFGEQEMGLKLTGKKVDLLARLRGEVSKRHCAIAHVMGYDYNIGDVAHNIVSVFRRPLSTTFKSRCNILNGPYVRVEKVFPREKPRILVCSFLKTLYIRTLRHTFYYVHLFCLFRGCGLLCFLLNVQRIDGVLWTTTFT